MGAEREDTGSFPVTSWTDVRTAAGDPGTMSQFVWAYRGPLVEFLCRKGVAEADAEDAVHQFFADRVLAGGAFLARADEARGRFRAYLRTAVWNFWVDRMRALGSGREAPNRGAPLVGDEASAGGEAGDAYDVALALRLFALTVSKFRAACDSRPDHWGLFEGRVLALVSGAEPVPYAELATRFGYGSEKQVANAFQTVQNRFRRCWAETLAGHLGPNAGAEGGELLAALLRAGPALLDSLRTHVWGDLPEVTGSGTGLLFPHEVGEFMSPSSGTPRDPGAALREALTAPVWVDAGDAPPAVAERVREVAARGGFVLTSFLDLFRHPNPPAELLRVAKDYAKAARMSPDGPLPPDVATVVYYTAIAVGLTRRGERITGHDDATLRTGFAWVAAQPWVGDEVRELIAPALARLPG